jgi:phosphodiesterase/alkaline phosphatase D-like protein
MTRIRRAVAIGLLSTGLLAGNLVLSGTSAFGFLLHPYVSHITEAGGSPLSPAGLALDSSGNLFVADRSAKLVDMFDSSGTFTGQLGTDVSSRDSLETVSVNDATGDVYVGGFKYGGVSVFKPEGGKYRLLQEYMEHEYMEEPSAIWATVNSVTSGPYAGAVYVEDEDVGGVLVTKPNAAGELVEKGEQLAPPEEGFGLSPYWDFATKAGIGGDAATGETYVANPGERLSGNGFVDEYNSKDVYLGHLAGPGGSFEPVDIAVEESTGDIYVVDDANNVVDEFDASGKFLGRIAETPSGTLSSPTGVAVNASGQVYVTDTDAVDIFGPAIVVPDVTSGAASSVARTSVKLEGVVNPEGEAVTSCEFEYGTTPAYGQTAACTPAPGSGSSPVPVSAEVSGLTAEATYHYRLVASGPHGVGPGADETFTTLPAVPELQTEAATGIEQPIPESIYATLHGSFDPDGVDTHYYFEYGETEAYGSVSPALPGGDAGTASKIEDVKTEIGGLKPVTNYHFRLVATNSFGTARGADMTFFTPARQFLPPVVGGQSASNVTQFAATLNGTLQTQEALVNYRFEYGATTAYGSIAPIPDDYAPLTTATVPVAQPVNGLQAGTTYHYRLVASSPGETEVAGPDETFTTLPIPAPAVATGTSSGIGVGSATLSGTIDPQGWDTSYLFQYGTSTAYGLSWPTVPVEMGALEGVQPVVVNIPNLLPDTTYHYRLVATNGGGTSYGQDMTFTTGEYPAQIIQEPVALRTILVPSGEVAKTTVKKAKKSKKKAKKGRKHTKSGRKTRHRKKKR